MPNFFIANNFEGFNLIETIRKLYPWSKVGGRVLKMGSSATLRHREVLELLSGQYKYSVIFNPPPPPIAKTEKGEENGLKRAEDKHLKRKLSHDSSTAESRSPKRTLTGRSDSSDHPFWFTPETPKSIQSKVCSIFYFCAWLLFFFFWGGGGLFSTGRLQIY